MLVRTLCRRQLTSIITYSFELPKQPVKAYFDNNYKAAREHIGKISTQFNMDKLQSRRAFNFFPLVFKPQSKQFQLFKERTYWVKQYVARNDSKGIGRALQKHLYNSNYIAFQFTKEQFDKFVAAIDKYFTNQAQIDKIFTACPNLMNSKLQQILQEKVGLLTDYLSISQQEAMEVFQTTPFLLNSSLRKIKQAMLVLHRNYGLSKQQLVQQMKCMGEIFLLGGTVLIQHHRLAIRWGLTAQQTKDTFLKNPLLFFNYPENILPYKRKLFRYLNFTSDMARQMYLQYPQIFIWSIRSLQQKALFLTNRMEINTNLKTLQLLTFNFNNTLRPRGQILIRSKAIYNQDNIISFMKLTDEQFCKKINVPIEKLIQEKAKYPISLQMDFRKGKKLQIIGARQKFIKLASVYQH